MGGAVSNRAVEFELDSGGRSGPPAERSEAVPEAALRSAGRSRRDGRAMDARAKLSDIPPAEIPRREPLKTLNLLKMHAIFAL